MTPVVIGPCTLFCADCRDVLPLLEGVDAVVTDPPYDLDIAQGNKGCFAKSYAKLTSSRLQVIADSFDISGAFAQWEAVGAVSVFCFCSNKQIPDVMQSAQRSGFSPTLLCWHKYNSVPFSHGTWRQDAEWCVHAKKSGAPLNGNATMKTKVKALPLCTECPEHPTTKPIRLVSDYVSIGSNPSGLVLDPFMGSGTTGVACVQTGRQFIGCEIDPQHFATACRRIRAAVAAEKSSLFPAGETL